MNKYKTVGRLVVFVLAILIFVSLSHAQSVPASVKREIAKQLSCDQANKEISAVKLGPAKRGYSGQCGGGGEAVLYEKTASGITKIFEDSTQMNGSMFLGKNAYRGYYEVNIEGHGSRYFAVTTYRWNGSSFARNRCEECDLDANGNSKNCRPC